MTRLSFDLATVCGLVLAFSGIVGGLLLEGGSVLDVAQLTAALVVFGGTLGAVLIACPMQACRGAAEKLKSVFFPPRVDSRDDLAKILMYAVQARKTGIVSLESELDAIENPFLQKALMLAVDGVDSETIREVMRIEMEITEQDEISHARVFEVAGGYAPTVGILGAVLGLIQVMKHLENIDEVGKGIAIAFVATVYGVGSANLLFLPAAAKIRNLIRAEWKNNEMLLEGVCCIAEGLNPRIIARKMEPFVRQGARRSVKLTSSTSETASGDAPDYA